MQTNLEFIHGSIALAVVFIVLGCVTVLYYSMRLIAASKTGGSPLPAPEKTASAGRVGFQPAFDVKSKHVAAITAAIMTATKSQGRILNITPAGCPASFDTTRRWRTAAIVEAVGRRLPPSWKR